jgi:hypothetical protein
MNDFELIEYYEVLFNKNVISLLDDFKNELNSLGIEFYYDLREKYMNLYESKSADCILATLTDNNIDPFNPTYQNLTNVPYIWKFNLLTFNSKLNINKDFVKNIESYFLELCNLNLSST